MKKDIRILLLTKIELAKSIEQHQDRYKTPFLDKNRLLAFIANPNLEKEDPLIAFALCAEKIIAHIILVPDLFYTNRATYAKKYWLSSWWVHPVYRATGVGALVFFKACNAVNNQVFVSAYSKSAADFYDKLNRFKRIGLRLDYHMFLAFHNDIIINKFRFLKPFSVLTKTMNLLCLIIFKTINFTKLKKNIKGISHSYVDKLDQETWDFIKPNLNNNLTHKTKASFNWQINTPQYYDPSKPEESQHVKVLSNGELIGFLSFIEINKAFRVICFFSKNDKTSATCVDSLMYHFGKSKTRSICTYDSSLFRAIKARYYFIYLRKPPIKAIKHNSVHFNINHNYIIKDYEGA